MEEIKSMVKNDIYYLREIAENTEGGGGGGGRPYDDTELRNRIIALENGKQDSLSAGSRITISSNTINTVEFIVDSINSATTTWSSNKLQSLFNSLAGKIEVSIVAEKPSNPVNSTMYYVGSTAPYDIWFYVNDDYTYFGTTDIDLSDYYTETEVDTLLNGKVDKVTGKSLVLDTDITQITTNKTDIAELKEEKQDKITDSTLSELADATTVSSVSATAKTNKTFTLSALWTWITGKLSTSISSDSTDEQIPSALAVWKLFNTNKKYRHRFVYYNTTSFEHPLCWWEVINNESSYTVAKFKTFLTDNGYTATSNTYVVGAGGISSTNTVSTPSGTAIVGNSFTGAYMDGTTLKFKQNYSGYLTPNESKLSITTTEL